MIPSGQAGRNLVSETARLYQAFANNSELEYIVLKASFVCQMFVLQKPTKSSKAKHHASHLTRRLQLWKDGKFSELLEEGRCIQKRIRYPVNKDSNHTARVFSRLMLQGKVKSAINFLSRNSSKCLLGFHDLVPSLNSDCGAMLSVKYVLISKHPLSKPPAPSTLLNPAEVPNHSSNWIIFEGLDSEAIRSSALRIQGSGGSSGLDGSIWRRMCCSFKSCSQDLCSALAAVSRCICSTEVDPIGFSAFVSCCLVPLNKCPGVRPIGMGEIPRRIISKAVLRLIYSDIRDTVDQIQVCVGQESGCEAAFHAMEMIFREDGV